MEWTNFYGRRFELYCQNTQFVNVQCEIKGFSNDTTQMHITEVTPCSVLISMATNNFKVPENYGKLKMVCKHIKNKSELINEQLLYIHLKTFYAALSYSGRACTIVTVNLGVCSIRVVE